ncbi:MAG: isoaspartyl peptidase/L-asparaginase [Deltaproteobacteria bacterium]|nr:isoaspartyl peptidase/L-asparaginase [Deltaproteobacteria bacterium]
MSIPAIIVHGGAGHLGPDDPASSGGPDAPRLAGVRRAAAEALALLQRGGAALDAVELAVRILEDDPTYNAGTGSCLTADGEVEMDASIMEGEGLRCGAVAAVKDVQNPVSLARLVMERTEHVLLVGPGASALARAAGVPAVSNERLATAAQRARFEAARAGAPAAAPAKHGTVGAAARDRAGHLAAATSTGGTFLKRPGRVGDTPIIGAGTYADDMLAAVSCTGQGERFIRMTMARAAADLVGAGHAPAEAAAQALRRMTGRVGGDGGLIVVGPVGEPGFAHNTPVMSRAWSRADGTIEVGL